MYQLSNFIDNDDIRTLAQLGPFQVIEYQRDLSVSPDSAQTAYFSSVMHVRRRQVLCDLKQANITLQAGAMPVERGQRQRHHRGQGGRRPVWESPPGQGHRGVRH